MKSLPRLLVGAPLLTLAAAFLTICVHFHTVWPWRVVVHEDGRRTLLETIFYFQHALGELPLEALLAAAVAGALLRFRKPAARQSFVWVVLVAAVALDALILIGSWRNAGYDDSLMFLLQYHTRDASPPEFGSHWRYHLLSQATLMLAPAMISGAANARALRLSWAAFAVASAAFGVSALSFSDPQYLGRQARETFTHGLVTVPLAVGTCLGLAEPPRGVRISWLSRPRHYWRGSETTAAFACGFLLLYQAAAVIVTGSQKHAQTQDFVRVVCGHFFEHTLSYLVVPVHAALFYLAGAPSAKT